MSRGTTPPEPPLRRSDYVRVAAVSCLNLVVVAAVFLLVVWGIDRTHEWAATLDPVGDVTVPGR